MRNPHPVPHRLRLALSGLAAASLATAGLALMPTPTSAAPAASTPAPAELGYAGAPVNPAPYTLTQPDGSTVRVHDFGDHLSHGVATVKGDNTLVKGSDGFWRYASGLTSSGKLKPSGVVAGQGTAPAASQHLAPEPTATATPSKAPMGGTGDDHELVILAQFNDVTHHATGSTEADWANHYFGATGSVDDFYDEASQGQFGLKPAAENCGGTPNDGVTGWITLNMNHPNTGVDGNATEQYVADAIKATEGCVDYASYDTAPADGQIETNELHVTIIGAGFETSYGGDECGKSIWGHEWDLDSAGITPPVVDGKSIGASGYTTFGEWHCNSGDNPGHKATMGIMAHEFGHDINWPDLYDTDGDGEGVGEWSLMGSGSWGENAAPGHEPGNSPSYPDAYSLYYQGWVMPTVATASNDLAVAAHQSLLLGPNPGGTDWLFGEHKGTGEFFMLENRTQQGYDVSTPGCGIVIYRIDETVTPSNGANADQADPLIAVMQADGKQDLEHTPNNRGDAGDPWPGTTGNHDFDNASTPNTRFHEGTPSNLDLHVDENACAPTMHVDVTHLGDASPVPVPPANDNFANAVTLTGNSGSTTGTNDAATLEAGEPEVAGHGGASVWYSWTPTTSGNATVTMAGSDFDTVLGVFTGSAVNALTLVAENDDEDNPHEIYTSKVVTHVTAGTTYRISADGYDGDTGAIKLAWSVVADPVTVNPTVTAVHTPEPSTVGSASSVTVSVTGTAGVATGQVTLKEGATTIGTGTLNGSGSATIAVPATTPVGTHSMTASYAGDSHYNAGSAPVTVTVNPAPPAPPVASTTTASAPKKVAFKKDFDVKVTVAAASGAATGTVTVLDGSKVIGTGTLANGVVTIHVTKNLKSGKHTLTVKYSGSTTVNASQATVTVKVLKKKKKHHHR